MLYLYWSGVTVSDAILNVSGAIGADVRQPLSARLRSLVAFVLSEGTLLPLTLNGIFLLPFN